MYTNEWVESIGIPRINLLRLIPKVLIEWMNMSLSKGAEEMSSSVKLNESPQCPPCPPHPPCPPQCPCGDQEYVLSEGHKVDIEKGKEVNHDFFLDPSPFKDCGTLSGRVRDKHGHALQNALVKVFDLNHNPIAHVFTNKDGEFLLCLPPGHYWVKAVH